MPVTCGPDFGDAERGGAARQLIGDRDGARLRA